MFGVIVALGKQKEGGKILLPSAWFIMIPSAYFFAFVLEYGVVGLIYGALCTYLLQVVLVSRLIYKQDWDIIS